MGLISSLQAQTVALMYARLGFSSVSCLLSSQQCCSKPILMAECMPISFFVPTYCRYDIISGSFTPTNQNRTSFGCRLVSVKPLFTEIRFCTSCSSILKFSREMSLSRRLLNYYFCRLYLDPCHSIFFGKCQAWSYPPLPSPLIILVYV